MSRANLLERMARAEFLQRQLLEKQQKSECESSPDYYIMGLNMACADAI